MLVNSRHFLYANTHSGFTYQGLLCKYQRKLVLAPCLMSHSVTTVTIRLFQPDQAGYGMAPPCSGFIAGVY